MFVVLTVCLVLGHTGRPHGAALVFSGINGAAPDRPTNVGMRFRSRLQALSKNDLSGHSADSRRRLEVKSSPQRGKSPVPRLRHLVDLKQCDTFSFAFALYLHGVGTG